MSLFPVSSSDKIESAFRIASERYAEFGIDAAKAVKVALEIPLSFHCWQADDVNGLEIQSTKGGGILSTGNFPGRARNGDEMRQDFDKVLELCPGRHRLNLHAFYAETDGKQVERDEITTEHFSRWMDWSKATGTHLDFNTTFYAHPKAAEGYTLSHRDDAIRSFWVRHGKACRIIATDMAKAQGGQCVLNHWIPDGEKDYPADRWSPRARLVESLDEMLEPQREVDRSICIDAVESKLFGIGIETYTVGSAEFYSSYALSRGCIYCVDQGHFHPTETISDKLSGYLQFHSKLLVHLSRPMRWDSDHVVLFEDDLKHVFQEIQRGNAWGRMILATDFFDASINRIASYGIGLRAVRKAILYALLDPTSQLFQLEADGFKAERLGLMEEMKTMPFGAVWDYLCQVGNAPAGASWLNEATRYQSEILNKRV